MDHGTVQERVINELERVESSLTERCHFLETKIAKETETAKKRYKENNRGEALKCLKRRKRYEQFMNQSQGAAQMLQSLCETLQEASTRQQFLHVLLDARSAVLHHPQRSASTEHCCIPAVPELHDDASCPAKHEEEHDEEHEITKLAKDIMQNLTISTVSDHLQQSHEEEDLLKYLHDPAEANVDAHSSNQVPLSMPSVPTHQPVAQENGKADPIDGEIQQLMAWTSS